jgi:biopolymer transport protein ExbB
MSFIKKPHTVTALKCLTAFALTISATSARSEKVPSQKENAEVIQLKKIKASYAKEYSFLLSEKSSLENRLTKFKSDNENITQKLENEVASIKKNISKKEKNISYAKVKNKKLLEEKADLDSGLNNVKSIPQMAKDGILKGKGIEFTKDSKLSEKLSVVFNAALEKNREMSAPLIKKGEFFSKSGKLVKGEIASISSFISYGKTSDSVYLLSPTEEGKLKASAKLEKDNISSNVAPVLLYENGKPAPEKKKKKLSDTLKAGGTIGYVILGLGLIAGTMLIFRVIMLRKAAKGSKGITLSAENALLNGDLDKAKEIVSSSDGSLNKVLGTSIDFINADKDLLETTMSEVILEESSKLDKFSTMIVVTAAVAPLLGLLGTVTGMIATFDIITEVGTGDPKMLSGGISEALVTTMFGLIVAIPTLFFGQLTTKWADQIKDMFEHGTLSIVAAYETYKTQRGAI